MDGKHIATDHYADGGLEISVWDGSEQAHVHAVTLNADQRDELIAHLGVPQGTEAHAWLVDNEGGVWILAGYSPAISQPGYVIGDVAGKFVLDAAYKLARVQTEHGIQSYGPTVTLATR